MAEPYVIAATPSASPAAAPSATVATYVVVGPRPMGPFGAVTGQRVDLTLTPDQASALIDAGHIVLASNYTPDPPVTDPVWD